MDVAVPQTPAAPAADYSPEQDTAAAVSQLKAARVEAAAQAAATVTGQPAVEAPAAPAAAVVVDPVAAPVAEDDKYAKLFERVSASERKHAELERTSAAKDAELAARDARLTEYDALFANAATDPEQIFRKIGWKPETIADYLTNGKTAVSPQVVSMEQKIAQLEAKLNEVTTGQKKQTYEQQVATFKSQIPAQLKESADKFPHLHTYFDTSAEMADQVFAVIETSFNQSKVQLTVAEAAAAVEKVLSEQAQRLSRARSQGGSPAAAQLSAVPDPSAPAAAKKPVPTLTNHANPGSTLPFNPESNTDDQNRDQAAAILRAARKAAA